MDKELQELEAELQRLRPRHASPQLLAAIASDLAAPAPEPRRNAWAWFALPLAAAAAGVLLLRTPHPADPAPPATAPALAVTTPSAPATTPAAPVAKFKPVSAENVLYAQSDDGLVTLADGSQAVRVRSSYVDTITWKNPATKASLRWSVPHTEVRVVPVSFH